MIHGRRKLSENSPWWRRKWSRRTPTISSRMKTWRGNNWKIPNNFKMLKMTKYQGTSDSTIHAKHYIWLMGPLELPKDKITLLFGHTLDGPGVEWFHNLSPHVNKDWDALVKEFVKKYSYISKVQVTLVDLEVVWQKPNEPFNDYYLRWMQKANTVKQKPSESTMIFKLIVGAPPAYSVSWSFKTWAPLVKPTLWGWRWKWSCKIRKQLLQVMVGAIKMEEQVEDLLKMLHLQILLSTQALESHSLWFTKNWRRKIW